MTSPASAPISPLSDAPAELDRLLRHALTARASDLHIEPELDAYEVRLRLDGVLSVVARYDLPAGRMLVARLMVLAQLLTYRTDVPQEGRLDLGGHALRVSTMPTAKGLRAVVRLPADLASPRALADLGMPPHVLTGLERFLSAGSGMLVVTGPAGSGKTTLLYALLQQLTRLSPGTSIVSLEDPVERLLPGVTQIEVTPFGQLTYERALRSMLRQDPQVLMIGEVRDPATATLAAQAAMSGHRLLCTLHADDPAGALRRLLDMGVAPHQVTSAVLAVAAVRLVRKLATPISTTELPSRYAGRIPLAEFVALDEPLSRAVLANADASDLRRLYTARPAHTTLRQHAETLIAANLTDPPEVLRVLGPAPTAP